MKKMSDVFNGKPCGFSPRMTDEQVRRGQHAINHVDALAAALEGCAELLLKISFESADEYQSAVAALAAYRGKS